MTLSANNTSLVTKPRGQPSYKVANGVTIYTGALVGLNASGYLDNWDNEAGMLFKGLAIGGNPGINGSGANESSVTGNTSATRPPEMLVDESGKILKSQTVTGVSAQGDESDKVFASDENTFTLTPTTNVKAVATVQRWHSSTTADIKLMTPGEYEASLDGFGTAAFYITLAGITGAQDVVTSWVPGFRGRILKIDFYVDVPVTTAAKAATLNAEIGTTNLTGGTVGLTSANCTPMGAKVSGAAVTGANVFDEDDAISIEAASVTAFAEGSGTLVITYATE